MAGIDKTYVSSWKDYKQVRDWAKNNRVVYPNGEVGSCLIDWFYNPCLTQKDFAEGNEEYVIWNTSQMDDTFLAKNCPVEFIQARLHEQYPGKEYDNLLKPFVPPEIERKGRKLRLQVIKMPKAYVFRHVPYTFDVTIGDKLVIHKNEYMTVSSEDLTKGWYYYANYKKFFREDECRVDLDSCFFPDYLWIKNPSVRKLVRLARNWDLPSGLYISLTGRYLEDQWVLKTI